jgi:quinol monooxygenase YgiN
MLVILGEFKIDIARRDDLIAAFITMQNASQKEDGCHKYVFTADVDRADVMHISECWESDEALKAHFAAPHMAAFGAATKGALLSSNVVRYEVSSHGPLRR